MSMYKLNQRIVESVMRLGFRGNKASRYAILLSLMLSLTGCISLASPDRMMVSKLSGTTSHADSVSVQTSSDFYATGLLDFDRFEKAIRQSINATKIFQSLDPAKSGDYLLTARLASYGVGSLDSSDTQIRIVVEWQLTRGQGADFIWADLISTKSRMVSSDSFFGATRVRLTTERAANANIREALEQIGSLNLAKQ